MVNNNPSKMMRMHPFGGSQSLGVYSDFNDGVYQTNF